MSVEITLIPEKQAHWTWSEENARECARVERELARLAETPVVRALASALGVGARKAAELVRNRACARPTPRAA